MRPLSFLFAGVSCGYGFGGATYPPAKPRRVPSICTTIRTASGWPLSGACASSHAMWCVQGFRWIASGHVQQAYVDAGRVITYACKPSVPITATDAGSASSSAAFKRLLPNEAAALIATSTIFSALSFLLPAANTFVCVNANFQQHAFVHEPGMLQDSVPNITSETRQIPFIQ
jgi:hypothetical protein